MRTTIFQIIFFITLIFQAENIHSQNVIKYVNPLIGTSNSKMLTRWGAEGGTYPGAVAPFGFVQLSPETRTGNARGYDYRDSLIYYFTCFRHFSGYPGGSGGGLKIMPLVFSKVTDRAMAGRPFSHRNEQAQPGYYKVLFDDNQSLVEVTSSVHAGMFRFTFPSGEKPQIYIETLGKAETEDNRLIKGEAGHTVIETNVAFVEKKNISSGFILSFPENISQPVLLKISFSDVNFESSLKNLSSECPSWNFDSFRQSNQEKWNQLLSAIEVQDPSEEHKTVFYTALYHSMLMPWIISDSEGAYLGADRKIHRVRGKNQYGAFSPWDTFRSLHPLLCLLAPDRQNDMILSALDEFEQTGKLPKGPMTGQHIIPIITDSYLKGIQKFDRDEAFRAMKATLKQNSERESDFDQYVHQGYVSYDYPESVTKTLEFAYDDWAVAQFAKLLNDSSACRQYLRRSMGYRNLFQVESKFFLPRKADRFISEPQGQGYKEGDKWIYSLFVPHDPVDLVNLAGGSELFVHKLDSALKSQLILFDNEPALHVPYLFNFTRQASFTQKWVRNILQNNYTAIPGGLPGNDDLGSMSSWYVFSALGFYPFCPGRPVYELGSPLFQEAIVHLPNGKKWIIRTENNSPESVYVKNIRLNGTDYNKIWLSHSTLIAGGEIVFTMGSAPSPVSTTDVIFAGRSETPEYSRIKAATFDFDKSHVIPDQPFNVNYSFENKGSTGTAILDLKVDGRSYYSRNVWVNAHETKIGTVECRLYPVGKRSLNLNELPEKFMIVDLPPKSSVKSKITAVYCDPLIKQGQAVTYSYSVKNLGGFRDTAHVSVILNDKTIAENQIVLDPGQQKIIENQFTAADKGRFVLKAGESSVPIIVYDRNTGSEVLHVAPLSVSADSVPDFSGMGNNGMRGKGSGCIHFRPSPGLDSFKNSITVMAWIFAGQQDDLSDIVTKGDYIVIQQNNHQLTFFAGGWGQGDCTVPLPPDWQNNWHHVAGVCKDNLLQLYIDGKLAGATTLDFQSNLMTRSNWMIGGNEEFPGQRLFRGKIDQVKIFKEALSAEEIQKEMKEKK
jgi:putative alpha-1,2-mannosidase